VEAGAVDEEAGDPKTRHQRGEAEEYETSESQGYGDV